jgi:hypothetical protein
VVDIVLVLFEDLFHQLFVVSVFEIVRVDEQLVVLVYFLIGFLFLLACQLALDFIVVLVEFVQET